VTEVPLAGGNVAASVVRIGGTVRKPATPATPAVHALLRHLDEVGFEGAPHAFGLDEQGRQVLEYVPGQLAHALPPLDDSGLRRAGRLIREFHDAAASFVPPPDAAWDVVIRPDSEDLVCHHDLAPWNLVRDGDRWVFIDWDGAGPGSRLWDLGYAAHGFVPLAPDGDPAADSPRLRALADGYGLDPDQRACLPELIAAHVRGMHDLLVRGAATGVQPWARLHAESHASYWSRAAGYVEANLDTWRSALGS